MKQILYDMGCQPFVRIDNYIDKELLVENRQGGGIIGEKQFCFKFQFFFFFWSLP